MMGLETEGDKKISLRYGDWQAMKLAIWRSHRGWEIITQTAIDLLGGCEHEGSCPANEDETAPCLPACKDREKRMSALVVLNTAKQFAPADARKPADGPYFSPSREYFSEVVSQLGAAQLELDVLRERLRVTTETDPPKELT